MNATIKNGLLALCLALGASSYAPVASAADPYLGGPSIMGSHESAVFRGGNFPPNAGLRLIVVYPDRSQHTQVVFSREDGTLDYQVTLTKAGSYSLAVQDGLGRVLKSVSFTVSQ